MTYSPHHLRKYLKKRISDIDKDGRFQYTDEEIEGVSVQLLVKIVMLTKLEVYREILEKIGEKED